jgi:hypothetical protein
MAIDFPNSPIDNDTYIDVESGNSYVYNATYKVWKSTTEDFTGFTGSVGFTGSRGTTGFTGSQGTQGVIGFTGSRGNTGFTGSQGIQGIQGTTGFTGSQGIIGFTGSRGIIGFTGSQGVTSNTFTSNVVISVADNSNAALRITQTGTGNALVVEDSASPDATPFVIDADGRVGVGTLSPTLQVQAVTVNDTDNRSIGVTETSYTTNFRAVYMTYYGNTAANTTYGVSNANLGSLRFQNLSAGLIGTNGDSPLIFATLSLERARITGAGNVGIGTIAPAYKVHIQTGGSSRMLTVQSTDANSSSGIGLTNDAREWSVSVRGDLADSFAIRDITSNQDRFEINANGNIGIGTSASDSWRLSIDNSSVFGSAFFNCSNDTNFPLFTTQRTREFYAAVQNGDLLGRFSFLGWSGTQNGGPHIQAVISDTVTSTSLPSDIIFATVPSGSTNPSDRMRITSQGNVGIGNSAPSHMLSVNGTTFLQGNLTLSSAVIANNSTGANGQVLTSTGSGVYWANTASAGITTGKAIAMAIVFG